jgi:hypothetical protein
MNMNDAQFINTITNIQHNLEQKMLYEYIASDSKEWELLKLVNEKLYLAIEKWNKGQTS